MRKTLKGEKKMFRSKENTELRRKQKKLSKRCNEVEDEENGGEKRQ